MATETLRPTGAGDETNIQTVTGAATHWEAVDDTGTGDDATTNVVHNTDNVYARDLYAMANSAIASGTINSVTIYIKHEGIAAYSRTVLKTNGTVYESGNLTTSGDDVWEYNSTVYTTNPQTGLAWTWAEIDAMQVGVGNFRSPTQQGRITQVYAVVDYTISTTDYPMTASAGSFILTGNATAFQKALKMAAAVGSFTLTGIAVAFNIGRGYILVAAAGVFTLTGNNTAFSKAISMIASAGTFTLSGVATILNKGKTMAVTAGSFVVSFLTTNLLQKPWGRTGRNTGIWTRSSKNDDE